MAGIDPPIRLHEDGAMFRAALTFTAAETGFSPRLLEKDYFCTLVLAHLSSPKAIVFKGGTCLAKVHAGFYRLSEDLDFSVSVSPKTPRSVRSKQAESLRLALQGMPDALQTVEPLRGSNNSTQYNGLVGYGSLVDGQEQSIRIELSLREPLLLPPVVGQANTVLLDPVSGKPFVPAIAVTCMSRMEAIAEKFRAALSRREAAIRDFFDLDYAVRKLGIQPRDPGLVTMVQQKLRVAGNDPVNISGPRLADLRGQIDARLKPVLRSRDFTTFDLDRAFALVSDMAKAVHDR
ncbi:MAG: nucleotidyl transferase AbiEii/AbiGii toxin family protein [Planctomycetota bacterium]|nr:nucleotidyl transferase AbiEii/AbiGii toxin family protein [Planctomycetota bacterium]